MDNLPENNNGKWSSTFKKEERLCSKKIIDKLFAEGKSLLVFPLKIVFIQTSILQKFPAQAAFTVGKRNFKHAVHRNLIKRKIREAYRLNKHMLYEQLKGVNVAVFIIFIGKSIPDFKEVEDAMKKGIGRLIKELDKNNLK